MNSYERYIAMIEGQPVDVLPRIPVLMHFAARYAGITYETFARDAKAMADVNIRLVEDFGFEQLDIMSDPYREATGFGAELRYQEFAPPRCMKPPLSDAKDLALLAKPDPRRCERMAGALEVIAAYKAYGYKRYSITGWVEGPAASGANLRGVQQFLMDGYEDEAFMCELMDVAVDCAIAYAEAQIAEGADTIGIGDAIASQMPPGMYGQFVAPREKRLIEAIHAAGAYARLHICGDTTHLLPHMTELAIDIIDLDWMVDMAHARAVLGPRVVLTGNLNPVSAIMNSDPESIQEAFRAIYATVGKPYFVNGGCEIPADTSHENLRAVCAPIPAS